MLDGSKRTKLFAFLYKKKLQPNIVKELNVAILTLVHTNIQIV